MKASKLTSHCLQCLESIKYDKYAKGTINQNISALGAFCTVKIFIGMYHISRFAKDKK